MNKKEILMQLRAGKIMCGKSLNDFETEKEAINYVYDMLVYGYHIPDKIKISK
jgi:hypothetical protein